ncbi:hypothetical protein [Frankia sp. AgB32]|uniref:hypothetical protein n=1 Tax=Frankia sp. AgB32 TaxID=631119 RepID=UPI002010A008|nr:hypothetical protein [Frankia sp. AgB32]MCK9898323.1 hypothetical protein [Frankia sp. AgB32]
MNRTGRGLDAGAALRWVAGSQYKLYLTDPLLAWLPALTSPGLHRPEYTAPSEMTLAVALARAIDEHDEGRWVAGDTIGYARTGSGNEIDLSPVRIPSAAGPTATTPVESTWIDAGWRVDTRGLGAKYGHGILATKSVLDLDQPVRAVPAPMLASLLG